MRRILRAPVRLYGLRLGWLLGHRFLLLTHVGRRTGLTRQTVLEVVQFDADMRCAIVVAGFGRQSDWYRNLEAQPAIRVVCGRDEFRPTHRPLSDEEAVAVLADYEERNRFIKPIVRAVLSRLLGWRYDGSEASRRRLVDQLPFIALWPSSSSHPALEANQEGSGAGFPVR
jgi:deazaflavin-dependent oxidoreductase (nitroreductase family)